MQKLSTFLSDYFEENENFIKEVIDRNKFDVNIVIPKNTRCQIFSDSLDILVCFELRDLAKNTIVLKTETRVLDEKFEEFLSGIEYIFNKFDGNYDIEYINSIINEIDENCLNIKCVATTLNKRNELIFG